MFDRRSFLQQNLAAFAMYALLRETRLLAVTPRSRDVAAWLKQQDILATALADGALTPPHWQDEVERLAQAIDFDALRDTLAHADARDVGRGGANDPFKRSLAFRDADGVRRQAHYGAALFAFDRTNVITPHGHRNMVSAHLVIDGRLRVRNYDRVRDEGHAMVLRPTVDTIIRPGEISTMSAQRNNVHWFVPQSDSATTFDLVIDALDPGPPRRTIEAVDPLHARQLGDGSLLAPIIGFDEASRLYTHSV